MSRNCVCCKTWPRAFRWRSPATARPPSDPDMETPSVEELWELTPDAIIAICPDRRILHWNRAAEIIFGFSRAEALGEKIDLIAAPDHVEDTRDDQSVFESIRRRKDGSLVHVSVSSKALRDADGRIRYVLSTQKDVTHLKVMRDA